MMQTMQNMKNWMDAEVAAGWKMLQCAIQEFWWNFVLAAAFWLLEGGNGGLKELAENMVYLRALKLLVELSNFLKEVEYYLKAQLEKLGYMERRMKVMVDSMRRVETLDLAAASQPVRRPAVIAMNVA